MSGYSVRDISRRPPSANTRLPTICALFLAVCLLLQPLASPGRQGPPAPTELASEQNG